MQKTPYFNRVLRVALLMGELILLNLLLWGFELFFGAHFWCDRCNLMQGMVIMSLCYMVCNGNSDSIFHRSDTRPEQVVLFVLKKIVPFAVLSMCVWLLLSMRVVDMHVFLLFYIILLGLVLIFRLGVHRLLKLYRLRGGNCRRVVMLGSYENMKELYDFMMGDATSGYKVVGYFEDEPSDTYPECVAYLGKPSDVCDYLEQHADQVDMLYCCLPSVRRKEIVKIVNFCENHLVRFFSVPNVRIYLKRRMIFDRLGSVPVLSIRREPLEKVENRLAKRAFDVLCTGLFLFTVFPLIYIVVGLAIKISSPGPVFFRQKRSGEDGREFWCYKFRSMKVNAQSDTLQATENDPRKTKVGEFIRKTSIDELPQLINVLKGDMSLVGPRPHMLKHTEEYSQLINQFMVRHLVKPGITGWAQVSGFRGETKELWQMEGRVQHDIWYIEHWTFLLDIYILYRTVYNAIKGDKEAY